MLEIFKVPTSSNENFVVSLQMRLLHDTGVGQLPNSLPNCIPVCLSLESIINAAPEVTLQSQ